MQSNSFKKIKVLFGISFMLFALIGCSNFNHVNSCKKDSLKIDSENILNKLKEKPTHLELIKCRSSAGSQVVCNECYRVPGKLAASVEQFLIEKYNMTKLIFLCCGWENSRGRAGEIRQEHFINKDDYIKKYYYKISMYSDETLITKRHLWHKIPYFYIYIQVLDI